jgi:hypothetical protein
MELEKRLNKKMTKSKKAKKRRDDDDDDDEPERKPFGRDRLKEIRNPDQNMFFIILREDEVRLLCNSLLTFYEWP